MQTHQHILLLLRLLEELVKRHWHLIHCQKPWHISFVFFFVSTELAIGKNIEFWEIIGCLIKYTVFASKNTHFYFWKTRLFIDTWIFIYLKTRFLIKNTFLTQNWFKVMNFSRKLDFCWTKTHFLIKNTLFHQKSVFLLFPMKLFSKKWFAIWFCHFFFAKIFLVGCFKFWNVLLSSQHLNLDFCQRRQNTHDFWIVFDNH